MAVSSAMRPRAGPRHEEVEVQAAVSAQLVDGVQGGVDGRVADGVVGAEDVVVDRARHADDRDVELLVQADGAAERAVSADGHQPLDARGLEHRHRLRAPREFHERLAARSAEEGAAALDHVADGAGGELDQVVFEQTRVAVADAGICSPATLAPRTTARMQAFMPGASPPEVRTPIRFMAPS
jgi:hypothetical protein